ncbi:MAG: hypothetical protein WAR37_00150 [Candidatus Microsaccharimonas sp.]
MDSQPPVQTKPDGSGLSLTGFILAIASLLLNFISFGLLAVLGLIFSIIGRVKTKRAGKPSGLALAGIIISSVSIILSAVIFGFVVYHGAMAVSTCDEIQNGTFEVLGESVTCTNGTIEEN